MSTAFQHRSTELARTSTEQCDLCSHSQTCDHASELNPIHMQYQLHAISVVCACNTNCVQYQLRDFVVEFG